MPLNKAKKGRLGLIARWIARAEPPMGEAPLIDSVPCGALADYDRRNFGSKPCHHVARFVGLPVPLLSIHGRQPSLWPAYLARICSSSGRHRAVDQARSSRSTSRNRSAFLRQDFMRLIAGAAGSPYSRASRVQLRA